MFNRSISLPGRQSLFLFGARGTGKSTLLRGMFPKEQSLWFDLLSPEVEERMSLEPESFRQEILAQSKRPKIVIVDEIQKCPKLLNSVHQLIEEEGLRFILTGSSARRLKQKGTNLLAGRAVTRTLFPLTHRELGKQFDLIEALRWGTLPTLYSLDESQEKADYLTSYALNYVQHEIKNEQWVRKLDPFRRFLAVAAQMDGRIVNFSKLADEVGAETTTVQSYYEILEDTLLGFELPAYHRSVRQQQRQAPKFFFFDSGVSRALSKSLEVAPKPGTSYFGVSFERWLIVEIFRLAQYTQKSWQLSYLLTKDGAEIDLILENGRGGVTLVEIKSSDRVDERDAKTLHRFEADFRGARALILSRDPRPKKLSAFVTALPWAEGLREIGI